jgi:spectinomycin phosphotransferase
MKDRPAGLDDGELIHALTEGWGLAISSLDYLPVGFGSYHWIVTDQDQRRLFATVDDLNHKGWLGDSCDAAFVGLRRAFDLAVALHDRVGLDFVVAPLPTVTGESVRRLGRCHTVALFPFVEGESGDFGDSTSSQHRTGLVRALAELHQTPRAALPPAQPLDLDFSGRRGLEAALTQLDRTWESGPYAEPARAWLASHADDLDRLLNDFDQLAAIVAAAGEAPVITHGEPHPGNVMRGPDGLMLIDWDTVGLAPPERDLWLVGTASGEESALYAEATGHEVSVAAMSLYRLAWDLADVAAFVGLFKSPHHDTQDTEHAWLNLDRALMSQEH